MDEARKKAVDFFSDLWSNKKQTMLDMKITSSGGGTVKNVVIQPDGVTQKQSSMN